MSFSINGIEVGLDQLDRIERGIDDVVAGSLYRWGERVMTESKEQEVPVDTGTLRSSGMVELERNGSVISVALGYGGAASNYAIAVHETNKNYRGGRKWKYLEDPIKRNIDDGNRQLTEDVTNFIGAR